MLIVVPYSTISLTGYCTILRQWPHKCTLLFVNITDVTLLSTFDILQALQHHPHQEQGTENNNCSSHSPLQMDCEQKVQQSGAIPSVNLSTPHGRILM